MWFDYYEDGAKALQATKGLKNIKSILQLGFQKGLSGVIQDNTSVEIPKERITDLTPIREKGRIKEGRW